MEWKGNREKDQMRGQEDEFGTDEQQNFYVDESCERMRMRMSMEIFFSLELTP